MTAGLPVEMDERKRRSRPSVVPELRRRLAEALDHVVAMGKSAEAQRKSYEALIAQRDARIAFLEERLTEYARVARPSPHPHEVP